MQSSTEHVPRIVLSLCLAVTPSRVWLPGCLYPDPLITQLGWVLNPSRHRRMRPRLVEQGLCMRKLIHSRCTLLTSCSRTLLCLAAMLPLPRSSDSATLLASASSPSLSDPYPLFVNHSLTSCNRPVPQFLFPNTNNQITLQTQEGASDHNDLAGCMWHTQRHSQHHSQEVKGG